MSSRAAMEPAISTLPVRNQLIAKVSIVPRVRQLTALSTDLVCVSAPRNKTTRCASLADGNRTYNAAAACPPHVGPWNHSWTECANTCTLRYESRQTL